MLRTAIVAAPVDTVARYLPANYTASLAPGTPGHTLISGEDVAGWTLDDYVIPRLASGLYFAHETTGD